MKLEQSNLETLCPLQLISFCQTRVLVLAVAFTMIVGCGKQEKKEILAAPPTDKATTAQTKQNIKKSFYVELKKTAKESLKIRNDMRKTEQDLSMGLAFRLLSQSETAVVLEQTIESLTEFETDNTGKREIHDMVPLIGGKLQITIDPRTMTVVKIDGTDALVAGLVTGTFASKDAAKVGQDLLEGLFRYLNGEIFVAPPPESVKVGEKWPQKIDMELGPLGGLSLEKVLTYQGAETFSGNTLHGATVTASRPNYVLPRNELTKMPFRVLKAEIKDWNYEGKAYFDSPAGMLNKSEAKIRMIGTVALKLKDEAGDAEVKREQTFSVRVLDTKPGKSKISGPEPDLTVDPTLWWYEWFGDPEGAQKKYAGKTIQLTGIVDGIYFDHERNQACIFIKVRGRAIGLSCLLREPEPWSKLANEQRVTLRTKVLEKQRSSYLTDCVIVDAGPNPALVVSAQQLAQEFAKDEKTSSKKYGGKCLIMEGKVIEKIITKDEELLGNVKVLLEGQGKVRIYCRFCAYTDKLTENIRVGDQVKLFGVCNEGDTWEDDKVKLTTCLPIKLAK